MRTQAMARDATSPTMRGDRAALPLTRVSLFVGLLLLEMVLLSIWHDTGLFAQSGSWFERLVAGVPQVLQIALAIAAAAVLLSFRTPPEAASRVAGMDRRTGGVAFVVHLLCFAAFALTCTYVIEGRGAGRTGPAAAVALCGGLAVATLAAWCAACLSLDEWKVMAANGKWVLAIAAPVGVAGWAVGQSAELLWRFLASATFSTATFFLRLLALPDIVSRPDALVLGAGGFSVEIAPHCSGYDGMGLIGVFTTAFLVIFRRELRFPQALALLPIGILAAWILNAARLAALIAIGARWSPEIALGGFHSQAGWIAFLALALSIAWIGSQSEAFSKSSRAASVSSPMAAFLAPLLALIAARMIGGAFSNGSDVRVAVLGYFAAGATCWFVRDSIRETFGRVSAPSLALGGAVGLAWIAWGIFMAPPSGAETSQAISASGVAWLALSVAGYTLVTPLVEELAFRGCLVRRWMAVEFETVPLATISWPAIVVTSLAFGLLHGSFWPVGVLAGIVFCLAAKHRGNLTDAIAAHCAANVVVASFAAFNGNWRILS